MLSCVGDYSEDHASASHANQGSMKLLPDGGKLVFVCQHAYPHNSIASMVQELFPARLNVKTPTLMKTWHALALHKPEEPVSGA